MFTWDVAKANANYFKHGVSFEEACSVFGDSTAVEVDDPGHSKSEHRSILLGESSKQRILAVVFTIRRLSDGKEAIRIISARQASHKERQALTRFKNRL